MSAIHAVFAWLGYWTGVSDEAGKGYAFFSGLGSDIGEVTLFGLAYGAWRHVNCHVKGCPRIGKHEVDGTPYKVCRRHHPAIDDGDITADTVKRAHRIANL